MRTLRHLLARRPPQAAGVEFCERCSSVYDARCRAARLREHARTRTLTAGPAGLR